MDGEVVGFVLYWLARPESWVREIAVRRGYKNQRVAAALILEVARLAIGHGSRAIAGMIATRSIQKWPSSSEGSSSLRSWRDSFAAWLGQDQEAEAALRRVQGEFTGHRLARHAALALSERAYMRSEWENALLFAHDAAESDDVRVSSQAWFLAGEAELRLRRFHEAVMAFKRVGTTDTIDPWIRLRGAAGMGVAYEHFGEFRLALGAYEIAAADRRFRVLYDWAQERLKAVKSQLPDAQ